MAGERVLAAAGLDFLDASKETMTFSKELAKTIYVPPKSTVDYQKKFDPVKTPPIIVTKTVVVSQDPAPDQVVPAGTEVKVTLLSKGSLPVGSFQVSEALLGKYGAGDVELVLKDIEEKGQAVKPIFESEKGFDSLSAAEKQAFNSYTAGIGLQGDAKGLFEDLQFFNNF